MSGKAGDLECRVMLVVVTGLSRGIISPQLGLVAAVLARQATVGDVFVVILKLSVRCHRGIFFYSKLLVIVTAFTRHSVSRLYSARALVFGAGHPIGGVITAAIQCHCHDAVAAKQRLVFGVVCGGG